MADKFDPENQPIAFVPWGNGEGVGVYLRSAARGTLVDIVPTRLQTSRRRTDGGFMLKIALLDDMITALRAAKAAAAAEGLL